MHLSLPIGRNARTPEERAFRQALRRRGYTLPPHRRPGPLWTPWVNRALRTSAEVEQAVAEIEACGLAPHKDRAKNWDLLVALGTILGRTNTRAAVLEMGAARYSRLLPWLYAYGYRRLVGIDLVPVVLKHPTMVDYRTMDLTATSFPDGSFDAIGCLSVIEHGVSPEGFAREAGRLLRPGGVAVLSTDFWCEPLDVAGKSAYGVPVHVLTPRRHRHVDRGRRPTRPEAGRTGPDGLRRSRGPMGADGPRLHVRERRAGEGRLVEVVTVATGRLSAQCTGPAGRLTPPPRARRAQAGG